MKIKFNLNTGSAVSGAILALVATGQLATVWLAASFLLFFELPGPVFGYATERGWDFKWWGNPSEGDVNFKVN